MKGSGNVVTTKKEARDPLVAAIRAAFVSRAESIFGRMVDRNVTDSVEAVADSGNAIAEAIRELASAMDGVAEAIKGIKGS
jgi:hypothetical protein